MFVLQVLLMNSHMPRTRLSLLRALILVSGRSRAQCALRWRVSVDPRLKWRLWAADEDLRLRFLREHMGYNWAMISASLDRSSYACRHRYAVLTKSVTTPRPT